MSVWITGDIHGNPSRFSIDKFPEQKKFSGNVDENIVIICGDFGIIWENDEQNGEERYKLDWLKQKPFTTVFVDGNHENFKRLKQYPRKMWHNGMVAEIRPNVLYLLRGEIYDIQGKSFFTFGGASSHDIKDGILDGEDKDWRVKAKLLYKKGKNLYRVKGISWWEEELPSEEEMNYGIERLKARGDKVDYIITHSPSSSELFKLCAEMLYSEDSLTKYLDKIQAYVDYDKHFFGHLHINEEIDDKSYCLYEKMLRLI